MFGMLGMLEMQDVPVIDSLFLVFCRSFVLVSTTLVTTTTALNSTVIQVNCSVPGSLPTGILQSFEIFIWRNDSSVGRKETAQGGAVSHRIGRLDAFTSYVITVTPWYLEGAGNESAPVEVSTPEDGKYCILLISINLISSNK